MSRAQVLIVGAGPTGLMLALWLSRLGVRVRIIDKTVGPGTTSRAIVIHARNLEFYRQLGIVDVAIRDGVDFAGANLWVSGKQVGHIKFDDVGEVFTRYPFLLIFPQDRNEDLLIGALKELGVEVERQTDLLSFECLAQTVNVRLRRADGAEETCEADYIAGCDGAHSKVRDQLGIEFPGGGYSYLFYVADLIASGPAANGEMHGALDDADFVAVFPMKGEGRIRLVGQIPSTASSQEHIGWEDVSPTILSRLGLQVKEVSWFSTYHVGHKVAANFRSGRAFLLGDAAHIHSPVGGQGMNTGLGDATNLGWKLAAAISGRADAAILDTYEPERIAFARALVKTTDRGFQFITSNGPVAKRIRIPLARWVLPRLFRFQAPRRLLFRTLSQLGIQYRQSKLSAGGTGKLRSGDRLPWLCRSGQTPDNFAGSQQLEWQAHVYGEAAPGLVEACTAMALNVHIFPWQAQMGSAGFTPNAIYIVRPDGYIGLISKTGDASEIRRYFDAWGIRLSELSNNESRHRPCLDR